MAAGKASSIFVPDNSWRCGYISAKWEFPNHNVVRYAPRGDPPEDFV